MTEWISVKDNMPGSFIPVSGFNNVYEERYACHFDGAIFISDETGQEVFLTHWFLLPETPI